MQLLTNATQRNNNNEEEDGDDDDDDDIQILDSSHQHDDDEDEDDLIGASRSRNDMMQDDDDDENNQDDEEDEDDEDDNEDGDYMQQDNEDEDDDDGDDDDDLDYNPIQRVNQQNIQNEMHVQSKLREKMEWEIKRRQTALKDHDFAQTIDLHTGRLDSRSSNVFHALDERSIENKMARKRSSYAKVMQNFIPNQPKGIVDQYDHQIFCGQFSKDGEIYMSACQDQIIRFYRTEEIRQAITQERTAQPFRELPARDVGWSIVDCHYSHDNRFAIYSTWSSFVYLFSIESDTTRTEAMDLEPRSRQMCPFSVRFSADSKEILAGTSDYSLYLYDIEQKKRVYHVEDAHQDDVNTVCFADSTPNIFFSAGDDGVCKVWDRRCFSSDSRSAVGMLVGHTAGITYLDSKGDGRYFITNGKDQVMKLWDIRRMKTPDSGDIPKISIPRDWDYRWGACPERRSQKIHPKDMSLTSYRGHRVLKTLIRCYFSPAVTTGQKYAYTGSADGSIHSLLFSCFFSNFFSQIVFLPIFFLIVYDLITGKVAEKLHHHVCFTCCCFRQVILFFFSTHTFFFVCRLL